MNSSSENTENASPLGAEEQKTAIPSRRRLFRDGASIVAVTLASRPVLAWHCQSPSVAASDAIGTSLKGKPGRSWADETWGLMQWKGNAPRAKSGIDEDKDKIKDNEWWEITAPWKAFFNRFPSTKTYNKLTFADLKTLVPTITTPKNVSTSTYLVCFLGSTCSHKPKHAAGLDWQKRVLIAQLNLLTLGGGVETGWFDNDLDSCVTLDQLNTMASGSYHPLGSGNTTKVWGTGEISSYLINNWMARDS